MDVEHRTDSQRHFDEASAIANERIDRSVTGSLGMVSYDSATMSAIQVELELAVRAEPTNSEYRYLLACAKMAAGLGETGANEIRALADDDADFAESAGYVATPDRWRSPFLFPQWDLSQRELSSDIVPADNVACFVTSVRDGCRRVVSFFRRIPQHALGPNFTPELRAAIRFASMQTPYGAIVGAYVLIDTHPVEPYTSETVLRADAYHPDQNDMSGSGPWIVRLLAQQTYSYVVLAEPSGDVYFNRKVEIDGPTQESLDNVVRQLASVELQPSTDMSRFQQAQQHFMNHFSLDAIRF